MPLIRVDDPNDRRLDPYRHLKRTNETSRRGLFIAEGKKLTRRLLAGRLRAESVLLGAAYVDALAGDVPTDVPTYVLTDDRVEELVGFNFHRGVLACGRRPPATASYAEWFADDRPATIVVCPDVQDPENLGAIIRLAAGFAVRGIVLGPRSADPFSRRVQRVSMGTVYTMPIVECRDPSAVLVELRERIGVESWAAVLDAGAEVLGTVRRAKRTAVVFGSEGHGLEPAVVAACSRRVTIPMPEGVDSLNAAVAAGIFLYELGKR